MEDDMFEFIFCTATPLSDRYKKSIVRRLKGSDSFSNLAAYYKRIILGDWTLYTGDTEIPTAVINRDRVKEILGVKRLKEW